MIDLNQLLLLLVFPAGGLLVGLWAWYFNRGRTPTTHIDGTTGLTQPRRH